MKRHAAFLTLCFLLAALPSLTVAVTAYPYGSLPTGAADADMTAAYTTW